MYESVCKKESAYGECILQDAQNMTEVVGQLGRKLSYKTVTFQAEKAIIRLHISSFLPENSRL